MTDLGRLGESILQQWAAQAGLILNRSTDHDAAGWDALVEWPLVGPASGGVPEPPRSATLSFDRRPAPRQCFVQVKTTARPIKSWDVKVSNWLRAVRAPLPHFFLVVEVDGALEPRRAHLVHVGPDHVRAVLKRVRELEARAAKAGSALALHKHPLPVRWGAGDALGALRGAAFRECAEAHIGPDVEAYARRKLSVVRDAGYENGGRRINARVSPPAGWRGDPRDLLLDFQLGLVPYLEVHQAEVFDTRFGIPVRDPDELLGGGRVETAGVPPSARAQARLRVQAAAPTTAAELRLDLDVRVVADGSGASTGDAPADAAPRMKARLSAPFLDLVLRPDGRQMDVSVRLPRVRETHPLAALRPAAAYLGLLELAHSHQTPVCVEVRVEGELLGTGEIAGVAPVPQPLEAWGDLVRNAWTAAKDADLPADVAVSVHDLARSRGALEVMAAMLRPRETNFAAQVTITSGVTDPERTWCFPVAAEAKIGPYVVQLGAGMFGHPRQIATAAEGLPHYRLEPAEVRVIERHVYHEPEAPKCTVAALQVAVGEAYRQEMNVVLVTTHDGQPIASEFTPPAPTPALPARRPPTHLAFRPRYGDGQRLRGARGTS